LGGGYFTVLLTSGSGNSGTQPPERKNLRIPVFRDPAFRIKDPPVPLLEKKNPKAKKKPPQFWSFQKISKKGSGSMKEPAVFWAVSYLTFKKKNLENHGYI
jgi:hypothetical protein